MENNSIAKQPDEKKPRFIKLKVTPEEARDGVVLYKGPTPIKGGNGQLELLLRSVKEQKRKERLAKLALKQEE